MPLAMPVAPWILAIAFYWKSKKIPRFYCEVHKGILLKNGRYIFLMKKKHYDLWTLIECNTTLKGVVKSMDHSQMRKLMPYFY